MTNQEILETFFERDKFTIQSEQVKFGLVQTTQRRTLVLIWLVKKANDS